MRMSAQESQEQNTAAVVEQFLTMPLNLGLRNSSFSPELAKEHTSQRLVSYGRNFVKFHNELLELIPPAGQFTEAIRNGVYDPIGRLATATAVEASTLAANYRQHESLTITDAFAIHGLMSWMASLNRPLDAPHNPDRTTFFLTHLSAGLARQVAKEELQSSGNLFDVASSLRDVSQKLEYTTDTPTDWTMQKFYIIADQLSIRKHAITLIDGEPTAEVDDIDELKNNNNALFKELKRLRRYSIKSAVHHDGTSQWSIHDSLDYREQRAAISAASEINPDQWPPNIRMIAIESLLNDDILVEVTHAADIIGRGFDSFGHAVFMDDRGQLFADNHGTLGYEDIYAQAGKPQNYEVLRQKLLRYYFDLTVPTEVARQIIDDERRFLSAASQASTREPNEIIHADLLLPRIRRLASFKTIGQMERFESKVSQEVTPKINSSCPFIQS